MKLTVVVFFSIMFLFIVGFIIFFSQEAEIDQNRNWVIEIAIYPVGHSSDTYFIQIDENSTIQARRGTRRDFVITTIHARFLNEIHSAAESILSDDEMQTVLSLAQELEIIGVIDEIGIADGTWEVILIYNEARYAMDYRVANLVVNHLGETIHEGAYPLYHYEAFLRLVDEVIRLSPLELRMY